MRVIVRFWVLALCIATTVTACASPPNEDVSAARASLDRAAAEGAGEYAPEALKAAQDAQASVDAELTAQDGKWFKSYDRARELAVATKAAGDRAVADAVAGKERAAKAAAAREIAAAASRAKARLAAVRVGGRIKPPIKIKDVQPLYPAIARSARVAGVVTIDATIGPDGKVMDTTLVRSIPLLDQAAIDAVRQWEYTPTLLNGRPVPVVVTIAINFVL
ncbi:MAG: energy transducer TonB [Acidobacteria bacterium]|nr:energy transducer TonB [Acidobacteriota bacterium]